MGSYVGNETILSSVVSPEPEPEPDLKPDCRHGEEVDRHQGFDVLSRSPPSLRWRFPAPGPGIGYAGLGPMSMPSLGEQSRGCEASPKRILAGSSSDQWRPRSNRWAPGGRDELSCQKQWKPLRCQLESSVGQNQGRSPVDPNLETANAHRSSRGRQLGASPSDAATPSWCRRSEISRWSVAGFEGRRRRRWQTCGVR